MLQQGMERRCTAILDIWTFLEDSELRLYAWLTRLPAGVSYGNLHHTSVCHPGTFMLIPSTTTVADERYSFGRTNQDFRTDPASHRQKDTRLGDRLCAEVLAGMYSMSRVIFTTQY